MYFFSDMISGTFYALLAGFWGAAASLCAKLSLGADYLRDMCETGLVGWSTDEGPACDWVSVTHTTSLERLNCPNVAPSQVNCPTVSVCAFSTHQKKLF